MQANTEKVKFGMWVAMWVTVYLIPQIGGFYFFAKVFL
jgi:hypothetical protein